MKADLPKNAGQESILTIAVWFGLAAGLIEGLIFLLFLYLLRFEWVSREILLPDSAAEIIWISPLFNGLLFGVIGLGLTALFSAVRRLNAVSLSVSLFSFLTFIDWLALFLSRRVYHVSLAILAAGLAAVLTRYVRKHEDRALRFWRRSLPWLALAVALIFAGVEGVGWLRERMSIAALPPAAPSAPNVLVIVADTLRADHLSCYGYARPTSPHLDRLAREGALFERAFSTSSWTAPSHASLLTGRYPNEHGVEWLTPRALLDGRGATLAEALRERGYRTAAFSANPFWFTRPMGFGRGFIRFEDFYHSLSDMALRTFFGRAFEQMVMRRLGVEDIPARKLAADVNRSAMRWAERDQDKPFFAFLNYMDAHDPYLPPRPFRGKFSRSPNPGGILNGRLGRFHPTMTPEELQGEIDAYDGAISYVDEQIGQLLDGLRRSGMLDRTIVVVTSDHGEAFGEHELLLHANSLYREVIHVPLIFWNPERAPAGARVSQPVSNAALPATIMEIIGDGRQTLFPIPSLAQLWRAGQAPLDWAPPMAEIARQPWTLDRYPVSRGFIKSLINPEWHYIRHETLGGEVYKWKDDAREERNLINDPEVERAIAPLHSSLQRSFPQFKETPAP